jgi:GT2 family glycosyltransferase/2-polyprenyl-3-methyl-5-hydroxy-6-metoxy-1,4-benzoquinol methylase
MTDAAFADLFPWDAAEVRASLAACAVSAFRIARIRLQRLAPDAWWADVHAWRQDVSGPVTWLGFRLCRAAVAEDGWDVEFPPYLGQVDGRWREALLAAFQIVATRVLDDPELAKNGVVDLTTDDTAGVPAAMEVGGDRITPGCTYMQIWLHHAKRYRFAATLARGADVLDLGCGVGYGTRMLARAARRVVGVDVSPEALAHAGRAYGGERMAFLGADARRLPLAGRSFDLVVCLEMLEHVREQDAVLAEAARVLRPGGRLVVSTPNKRLYADQPDPGNYHCALLTLEEFRAVVAAHFGEVEVWSQRRPAGLADPLQEFELEPGADESQEIFVAVASAPRSARPAIAVSPAAPARAPAATTAAGDAGLTILTFNWHEAYFALLARAGHRWLVADWDRSWNSACRPLPANAQLVSDAAEAADLVAAGRVDLVVAQTAFDLAWVEDRAVPLVYLAHNHLVNDVRDRDPGAASVLQAAVARMLERHGGLFVTISEMKRESWGLDGAVIPPGIDVAEYGGYRGDTAAALTVANLLRERAHMLGFDQLQAGLEGLPWTIVGASPSLQSREATSWDALKDLYRAHRLYAHATQWPWEDGHNLALLEAMATGMPVVAWANPTSVIREGRDGFVADDPETFTAWTRRLLDDHELAHRLGEQARRRVAEQFPLEAFVERWRAALAQAANSRPPAVAVAAPWPAPEATPIDVPAAAPIAPRAPRPRVTRDDGAPPSRPRVVLATAWTPISTSAYYERAFRAAGHDVLTWGPHMDEPTLAQWREVTEQHALKATGSAEEKIRLLRGLTRPADVPAAAGQPSVSELLARLPRGWQPDLFVWIDGGPGFLPVDLERLDCPTACLVGDTHTQIDWRLKYARLFSHVFVMFNRPHVAVFERAGCPRVAWLPAACDPQIHRAFDVPKAFDVVFVGQTLRQWHPDRVRLLERLVAAGFDVHVTTKILEEMALAFARGRIVFNRSLAGDLNMRVFETLATGNLLLTDRLAPEAGLDELLHDGVHLVCYDDDTLEDQVRHHLDHPAEAAAIARQGRHEALRRHTYRHRVDAIMAAVSGAGEREAAGPVAAPAPRPVADYYEHARPELVALVRDDARRVLDVGCAAGAFGAELKRHGAREVVGIERDPVAAMAARARLDEVLEADLDELVQLPWPEGSFDCIVCADVLEHLREPARVLTLLGRYLAPGGRLIASIPNVRHTNVLLPLLVSGRWQYADEGILDRTHLRFFTAEEIVALFAECGYVPVDIQGRRTPDHPGLDRVTELVAALGGDPVRFREEANVMQYVVEAERQPVPGERATGPGRPSASIVIPVHDRAAFTARCLQALARTVDVAATEVIVVDNASTDETAALLARAPLPVRVVRNAENLGFARACNQGAREATGELLVFLNNDTEPEPGWLDALREAAGDPGVGIVGARLLYPGTRRIQHAGLALTPDGIPDHLWRSAPEDDPRANVARDADMVTGACLAIRGEVFLALGGFDEAYVNGVEDVDLCLAARAAGLRVRYEPRAVVLHHEGVTEGRFHRVPANLARFAEKWRATLAGMERRPAADFGTLPGPTIAWEGTFFRHHSLAGVNRALCQELARRGVDLVLTPYEADEFDPGSAPDTRALARLVNRPTKAAPPLRVRHRFPPDFTRRPGERLVLIQPWEFGAVPADWVRGIRDAVDELWVPSEWVRRCYVEAGVPASRVVTIPNGFDPAIFHPAVPPLPLPTARGFRFLYVGGTIFRKGYDVLLRAYTEEFSAADDVTLVLKDHAYYGHRLDEALDQVARRSDAPQVLYYFDSVTAAQLAGFYTAATCLVHPFRGEGFGLPILEAMACGRPVIVTDAGPVREFCPDDVGRFVPATPARFPEARVEHLATVGVPWLVEPDVGALRRAMRAAYEDRDDCRRRGERAARHAHARYTWATIAARYAERLATVLAAPAPTVLAAPAPAADDDGALARAATSLQQGDLRAALPLFSQALRRDPACVPALLGAAHCALGLDEPAAARRLLHHLLRLEPDNACARAALEALDATAAPRSPA